MKPLSGSVALALHFSIKNLHSHEITAKIICMDLSRPWCWYIRVAINHLRKQIVHFLSMIFFVESFWIQIYFSSTNNKSAFMGTYHVFCKKMHQSYHIYDQCVQHHME